jgi:hypothetical protein
MPPCCTGWDGKPAHPEVPGASAGRTEPLRSAWRVGDAPGRRQIARVAPEGGALKFTFRRGVPAWGQLVGTAGLRATVVVDRESHRILNDRFRGRR